MGGEREPGATVKRLIAARQAKKPKMSLSDLAQILHVSTATVGHWETGIRVPDDLDVVKRWIRAVGLPAETFDDFIEERAVEDSLKAFENLPAHLALPAAELESLRRNATNAIRARRQQPRRPQP